MDREDWDRRYAAHELLWSSDPNRFLAAEASDLEPGVALDLACGEGRNALWLAELGWRVTAVDFSTVAIARVREIAARRGLEIDWVLADVMQYEAASRAFDLVVILYLQVPLDELRGVLAGAAGAVATGGVLVAVGHHTRNVTEGYGGPKDPALGWTPEQVAAALGDLHIERADTVSRPVETAEGTFGAIDVVVRATRVRPQRPGVR